MRFLPNRNQFFSLVLWCFSLGGHSSVHSSEECIILFCLGFIGNWGSHLVSSNKGLSTAPTLVPLPQKVWAPSTSKCRKYQEGQMQTSNSAPLGLIWILMTKAPLQSVRIREDRLSPDPVTVCQWEKEVNFHWLFFRAGYCTLMNNQKATSWKITGPLTALVLNLPCTFSYVLPLIADIISAWPPLWHQFYSNIAVSCCLCASPCFPGLFHWVCLICQSSPSLPPQSWPFRKGCLLATSISAYATVQTPAPPLDLGLVTRPLCLGGGGHALWLFGWSHLIPWFMCSSHFNCIEESLTLAVSNLSTFHMLCLHAVRRWMAHSYGECFTSRCADLQCW